jgi:hypothetical protein
LVAIVTVYVRLGSRWIVGADRCGDWRGRGSGTLRHPPGGAACCVAELAVLAAVLVELLLELPQPASASAVRTTVIDPALRIDEQVSRCRHR